MKIYKMRAHGQYFDKLNWIEQFLSVIVVCIYKGLDTIKSS